MFSRFITKNKLVFKLVVLSLLLGLTILAITFAFNAGVSGEAFDYGDANYSANQITPQSVMVVENDRIVPDRIVLLHAQNMAVGLQYPSYNSSYIPNIDSQIVNPFATGWQAFPTFQAGTTHSMADNNFIVTSTNYSHFRFIREENLPINTYFRFSVDIYSSVTGGENNVAASIVTSAGDWYWGFYSITMGGWQRIEIVFNSGANGAWAVQKSLFCGINWGGGGGETRGTTQFRNIRLERLNHTTDNNWRILGVVMHNLDVSGTMGGSYRRVVTSMDANDINIATSTLLESANSLNSMSNNLMEATVEILEVFTPITEFMPIGVAASGGNPASQSYSIPEQHLYYIISRYIDTTQFDHFIVYMRLGRINGPEGRRYNFMPNIGWAGLNNPYRGGLFSYVRFSDNTNCTWHTGNIFPDRVAVHEVIHTLERYSVRRGVYIPSGAVGFQSVGGIDFPERYWPDPVGWNLANARAFYTAVMRRQITHRNGVLLPQPTIGFTQLTYLRDRFVVHSVPHSLAGTPLAIATPSVTINDSVIRWNRVAKATGYHVYVNGARRTTTALTTREFDLSTLSLNIFQDNVIAVRAITTQLFRTQSVLSEPVILGPSQLPPELGGISIVGGDRAVTFNAQSFNLSVEAVPVDAQLQGNIIWSSSNSAVATINASGRVMVSGVGAVVITAQMQGGAFNDTITLTVNPRPIVSITIMGGDRVMQVGDAPLQLSYTINPSTHVGNYTIVWTVSNDSVLSVSDSGRVTALSAGESTLTATVQGTSVSSSITITVNSAVVPPSYEPPTYIPPSYEPPICQPCTAEPLTYEPSTYEPTPPSYEPPTYQPDYILPDNGGSNDSGNQGGGSSDDWLGSLLTGCFSTIGGGEGLAIIFILALIALGLAIVKAVKKRK